eukprot:jgi/Bigna1/146879/aug1.123_g21587
MASKGKFESTLANNGIAVVYPSAKCIPYTLAAINDISVDPFAEYFVLWVIPKYFIVPLIAAGMKMSVWHDRTGLGPKFPEDTEGIRNSLESLDKNILNPLATKELPVVVGGFSQGGHMAMHVALNDCSNSNYNSTEVKLPLLMTHGTRDRMISSKWGEKTAKKLKDVGLDVRFKLIDGITSIQLVE